MSYSSPVFTMPGASTEKLPFVHSHFKPRSKFAKSFGGRRIYSKLNNSSKNPYSNVQKLPQITYNAVDQRRTVIAFGTVRQGLRREYPGFLGHAKILRRHAENGKETDDKGDKRSRKIYKYDSLPDLTTHKRNNDNSLFHNNNVIYEKQGREDNDGSVSSDLDCLHNSLESLIFVDDDKTDCDIRPTVIKVHPEKDKSHHHHDPSNDHDATSKPSSFGGPTLDSGLITSGDNNNQSNSPQVNFELLPMESMSKELDKKINEARGKSGMKRSRRRDNNDHHNIRMLGDLMTSKRLTELLSPRKQGTSLSFN